MSKPIAAGRVAGFNSMERSIKRCRRDLLSARKSLASCTRGVWGECFLSQSRILGSKDRTAKSAAGPSKHSKTLGQAWPGETPGLISTSRGTRPATSCTVSRRVGIDSSVPASRSAVSSRTGVRATFRLTPVRRFVFWSWKTTTSRSAVSRTSSSIANP